MSEAVLQAVLRTIGDHGRKDSRVGWVQTSGFYGVPDDKYNLYAYGSRTGNIANAVRLQLVTLERSRRAKTLIAERVVIGSEKIKFIFEP